MHASNSQTDGVGVDAIGQIAVPITDLDRAVHFYRDVLGLRLLFQAPPGLAFLECGGVRLMLTTPQGTTPSGAPLLYYRVPHIRAAHHALSSQGVQFEDEPHRVAPMPDHDLWMTFCRDSEGNLLALMAEVRPPGSEPT